MIGAADDTLIVLPPIPTADLGPGDVDELTKRVRASMLEELERLTAPAHGQNTAAANGKAHVLAHQSGEDTSLRNRQKQAVKDEL